MNHADFRIGIEFWFGDRLWRCTDVGSRTVLAIRIDQVEKATYDGRRETRTILTRAEAEAEGWFNGPPYGVAEAVFDEYDLEACEPA
jgi:hypothetical protein